MVQKKNPEKMLVAELRSTHEDYELNYNEWRLLLACYEGTKELIRLGLVKRNERETQENYDRRIEELYNFNYTKSVIDLFNFYLFKKPVKRTLPTLEADKFWVMFMEDCNLYGDEFDDFLTEMGRYSSIMGYMGILVDKPDVKLDTQQEELDDRIYPYVAAYFPTAILDWEFKRDKNNRPYLHYLKLLDDDEIYRMWWQDKYEVWELPEIDKKTGTVNRMRKQSLLRRE